MCNELNDLNVVAAVCQFFYDGGGGHFLQAVSETISPRLVGETSGSQSLGAFAKGSCISSFLYYF